MIAEEAIK